MELAEFRSEVGEQLLDFAWRQWAQMGSAMVASGEDQWAMDPEALLLLSLELGRGEPRLFEECLDWALVNHRLLSIQRLKNLCSDDDDRRLAGAAIEWIGEWKAGKPRPPVESLEGVGSSESLLLEPSIEPNNFDPAFLDHGLIKPWNEPARRANEPDQRQPINFAFRLRGLCGVGAKAEVLRVLLGSERGGLSAQELSGVAGYAKRNVQEALAALSQAGFVDVTMLGNQKRFAIESTPWLDLLGVSRIPEHIVWPYLFAAFRLLVRWMRDSRTPGLSNYMLASDARSLTAHLEPHLGRAGISIETRGRPAEEFWPYFAESMLALLAGLRTMGSEFPA